MSSNSTKDARQDLTRCPDMKTLPVVYPTPIIVGVAGSSGSGKSKFSSQIVESLPGLKVEVISLDCFYYGLEEDDDPAEYNFDDPSALDYKQCLEVMKGLKVGEKVQVPIYDMRLHKSLPQKRVVGQADIILLEGIFAFHWKELRDLMDMKVYIHTDTDTCLVRRIRRDITERGRTLESVLSQYEKFVKPAFDQYIDKTKVLADMILPNNLNFSVGLECIVKKLESLKKV